MSKYKITKKVSSKKTKFSVVPLLLFVLIVAVMFFLGYLTGKKTTHTHNGNEAAVEVPGNHIHEEIKEPAVGEEESVPMEEPKTFPSPGAEAVNTVQMGDNIRYTLYTDGTLLVVGAGSTWDFETPVDVLAYFVEQLQTEPIRAKKEWFYSVTNIVIDGAVTRLGKNALGMHTFAESVTHLGVLESVSENAFRNCGAWLESNQKTTWNVDLTNTKIEDGAFNGCSNPPVECKATKLPGAEEGLEPPENTEEQS